MPHFPFCRIFRDSGKFWMDCLFTGVLFDIGKSLNQTWNIYLQQKCAKEISIYSMDMYQFILLDFFSQEVHFCRPLFSTSDGRRCLSQIFYRSSFFVSPSQEMTFSLNFSGCDQIWFPMTFLLIFPLPPTPAHRRKIWGLAMVVVCVSLLLWKKTPALSGGQNCFPGRSAALMEYIFCIRKIHAAGFYMWPLQREHCRPKKPTSENLVEK